MLRRISFLLLILTGLTATALAQDATPELDTTPEVTLEATTEIIPEATIEITVEANTKSTAEAAVEATAEATPEATPADDKSFVPEFPGSGSFSVSLVLDGVRRIYNIYIPDSYDADGDPVPLILAYHGAGGTGAGIASYSGFNDVADEHGLIVVYPDGINRAWNDGRTGDPRIGNVNDLGFTAYIIDSLVEALNIDPDQVYATGHSMGGMFSFRLACELSDQVAAVASVASTMPRYLLSSCEDSPAVPVMIVQGTDDSVVPWMGYENGYLSARDSVIYWARHNGCEESSGLVMEADVDPDDGTLVVSEKRTACDNGADVTLYGIVYGGHTWPGHVIAAPFELGLTGMDIDATHVIYDFFSTHPRQPAEDSE